MTITFFSFSNEIATLCQNKQISIDLPSVYWFAESRSKTFHSISILYLLWACPWNCGAGIPYEEFDGCQRCSCEKIPWAWFRLGLCENDSAACCCPESTGFDELLSATNIRDSEKENRKPNQLHIWLKTKLFKSILQGMPYYCMSAILIWNSTILS